MAAELLTIIRQLPRSFYYYYQYSTKTPKKYPTEKHFVKYALRDEEVLLKAREYLDLLRGSLDKVSHIIGELKSAPN